MTLTPEQRRIARRIVDIGNAVGATPKEKKAALETGIVESNLSNPRGGDADSAGWRQERASLYKDPTNLDASIKRFFAETRAVKDKYGKAGDLAAAVQRPAAQYRGRYQAVSAAAGALLGGVAPRSAETPSASGAPTTKTTTAFDAQGFDAAKRRALVGALIAKHNPNSILLRAGALTTRAPDRAAFETTSTKTTPGRAPAARIPASASAPARDGKVTVAAGAERNGIGLQRPILGLLNQISAAGKRPLTVTTGTNHNRLTVDGNVSDHWEGNAADLGVPVDSQKGDLIAAHAIQVAGGLPFDKALAMARAGGIHNFQTKQGKVQVIWRTYEGGNHHNHVHIGLNPHA